MAAKRSELLKQARDKFNYFVSNYKIIFNIL
jgi:hypothetical protein